MLLIQIPAARHQFSFHFKNIKSKIHTKLTQSWKRFLFFTSVLWLEKKHWPAGEYNSCESWTVLLKHSQNGQFNLYYLSNIQKKHWKPQFIWPFFKWLNTKSSIPGKTVIINIKAICRIQTAALRAVEQRSILTSGVMLPMIKAVVILCDYGDYMLHESKLGFINNSIQFQFPQWIIYPTKKTPHIIDDSKRVKPD